MDDRYFLLNTDWTDINGLDLSATDALILAVIYGDNAENHKDVKGSNQITSILKISKYRFRKSIHKLISKGLIEQVENRSGKEHTYKIQKDFSQEFKQAQV